MACARNLGGYSEPGSLANCQFKTPSTAAKCGYALKKAALIKKGQALRSTDMNTKNEINCFLELYEGEWAKKVTNPALRCLAFRKHNAPQYLPLTDDLLLLRKYLIDQIETVTKKVESQPNKENWRELAVVTLARMIIFNKRRGNYL